MRDLFTPSLLLAALRVFSPRLTAELHAAGHTEIRPRHIAVFTHLDPQGMRFRMLADRAGVGTAAMGALVDELERLGYVMPRTHAVGRAQLVTPTRLAAEVTQLMAAFNERHEMEIRRLLGPIDYESFRRALHTLADSGSMATQLPAPQSRSSALPTLSVGTSPSDRKMRRRFQS